MDNSESLVLSASESFVETHYIKSLTQRALDYIKVGFPVHLNGPAGVGKTTLALHIAAKTNRPVVLICGDHEFNSSDLVGGIYGYKKKYVNDNFIRTVVKKEESMTQHWVDNRLTTACKNGYTLIYDEFTRSRPEANNVLLSVLEEGILPLPTTQNGRGYIKVHPDFKAIFTSNPEEYAGVFRSQDALLDRMVTIELANFDIETEIEITRKKSRISKKESELIVRLVRDVRDAKMNKLTPTVRACIIIGKIVHLKGTSNMNGDFRQICQDVLFREVLPDERQKIAEIIDRNIDLYFRIGEKL